MLLPGQESTAPHSALKLEGAVSHAFAAGRRIDLPARERSAAIIMRGLVRAMVTNDAGKEVSLDILSAGEFVGNIARALEQDPPVTHAAPPIDLIGVEAGELLVYDLEILRGMIESNASTMAMLAIQLENQRRRLEDRLLRLLFKNSNGKVAGLLVEFARRFGNRTGTAIEIPIRLTHREIGSFIGVKRETVSLAMAELELREYIAVKNNVITVLDPDKLLRVP